MPRFFCAAVLLSLAASTSVSALDIQLIYETSESDQPFYDKEGKELMAIMDEAAARWEDIIEDNHTIEIFIRYEDIDKGDANSTTLATAQTILTNTMGNRITQGRIRFDTPRSWYFDPTPEDDDEFKMESRELFELSLSDQNQFFTGDPLVEPLLEIGYLGVSTGSDPNADTSLDVLSTAMHEMGHLLGITNYLLPAGQDEIDDFDFDLPASLLGGRSMAAQAEKDEDTGNPEPHLEYTEALLSATTSGGMRALPSALDVFAAAAISDWTKIDLPRQDFLTGTDWGVDGNWEGGQEPDSDDDVFIRHGGDVSLNKTVKVANLTLNSSSNLYTGAHELIVNGTTTIEFDGVFPFPQIFVQSGGSLTTEILRINGGELDLEGGSVSVSSFTENNASIAGYGNLTTPALLNNGEISASDDQLLTIQATAAVNGLVLDGAAGDAQVEAIAGDLRFVGSVDPVFTGTMQIGDGHFIEFDSSWTLALGGHLDLDSAGSGYAVLQMPELTIQSTVDVDKLARINGAVATSPDAVINLPDADDRLELGTARSQAIEYNGGVIQGEGTLVQNGDASVRLNGTQVISVATFDWDGSTVSSTTVGTGSFLHLDIDQLADTMDGDVFMDAGHLRVGTLAPWQMRGTMFFDGFSSVVDGADIEVVTGGKLDFRSGASYLDAAVDLEGEMDVAGQVTMIQEFTFRPASVTEVLADGELILDGDTNFNGGQITGAGLLCQNGPATVTANQTINLVGAFDWDGTSNNAIFTVESGREFYLTAANLNPTHDIYNGDLTLRGALASVNVADDLWFLTGQISLVPGDKGESSLLLGDQLDVLGEIVATGAVAHTISAPVRFITAASALTVGSGTTVQFNAPVDFYAGTHSSIGAIAINDRAVIDGAVVLSLDFSIGGAAKAELRSGRLRATEIDAAGDFTMVGGILSADLYRGNLLNEGGTVGPGPNTLAVGVMVVDGSYEQTDVGTLEIHLAGSSTFDLLEVTGDAILDGRLDVELLNGFLPELGDRFKVLTADAVIGEFTYLSLPSLEGQLGWELTYDDNFLSLDVVDVVFEGDYNDDGVVDLADYTTWRDQLGSTRPRLANEVVTPGQATIEDYLVWKENFGAIEGAGGLINTTPEPHALWLLSVVAIGAVARRGRAA